MMTWEMTIFQAKDSPAKAKIYLGRSRERHVHPKRAVEVVLGQACTHSTQAHHTGRAHRKSTQSVGVVLGQTRTHSTQAQHT